MMSLLSKPRHTVTVEPLVPVTGSLGQTEYVAASPIPQVRCNVHLTSSTEVVKDGTRDLLDGAITSAVWPWPQARITYNGEVFDQVGAPVLKAMGRRTRHYTIGIRRRKRGGAR